ncbi:MAG: IS4 family transposase [Chloroflexi bacterium]|nr:IS4 family transposase [Chloroflexota bacterium]
MRTILHSIPLYLVTLIEQLRAKLHDDEFKARHRVRPEDFTRHRQLTFPVLMLFVLQKTVKSIQRHLHEFLDELAAGAVFEPVTAGAVTHARAKLKHTAFLELNQQVVLPTVEQQSAQLQRWHGHRLFGHDSSLLRLPDSPELAQEFGRGEIKNQGGATGTAYPEGRMSVLYDLLNRIGVEARLESSRVGEVSLAIQQAVCLHAGDVAINDRGFTGYRYLAEHVRRGVHVIGRCSTGSFAAAQELFRMNRAGRSQIVKLFAPADQRAELQALGLPLELIVRFISLRLPGGKLEVLVTTLLDETEYPTEEFRDVYHWRWGHETFYHVLKSRLDLENFSGETVEAVRQDFHAAVLLCNLESLLTQPAQTVVQENRADDQQPQQINGADAYHALKDQLLVLLYSDTPAELVIRKLQGLFLARPISVPPGRKAPRRKPSFNRSYHFQRHVKKIVF